MQPERPDAPPTVTLFGLPFVDASDIDDIARYCVDQAERARAEWSCVVTPNVDHLVRYDADPTLRAVAADATMILPDGMPIVWASRLLGRRLRARLTGADLFSALVPLLGGTDVTMLVVASSAEVAELLEEDEPRVRALVAPMIRIDDEAGVGSLLDDIETRLDITGASICVIGLSMDKHHLIAARLHDRWTREGRNGQPWPTVMLLGASPDLHVGAARRAPRWMQRAGLEWLHRLSQDPRRMARRYLVDDPAFARLVIREARARRRQRAR